MRRPTKRFRFRGEGICVIIFLIVFLVLKQIIPTLPKDSVISLSAEVSLILVASFHTTSGDGMKRRAARMCLLCAISCSCWLVCMGNRSSSNVFFEASFMILIPFVSGLMKTAFAYYFRQREVPDTDIESVNRFFWLHFGLVIAGVYSLQYVADVDETKQSLHALNKTIFSLNTETKEALNDLKVFRHICTDLKLTFALLVSPRHELRILF